MMEVTAFHLFAFGISRLFRRVAGRFLCALNHVGIDVNQREGL